MVACRMNEETNKHLPVMLDEVIENLAIKADGVYVDATFGRGGHTQAILSKLSPAGRLFVLDKDPEAIAFARQYFGSDSRFVAQQGSFTQLETLLKSHQLHGQVDGILFDLGVSSPQLDTPERGFSFMRAGKLDMRMDSSQGIDAATWIATVPEKELANVLWEYGEERFSRRVARSIVQSRTETPITTTDQLAAIVSAAIPNWEKGKHPATRSFQAIRIAINHELDDLQLGLAQSLEALKVGGRLLVISFHSLEDRLVKHFIQRHERGDEFPAGLPIKQDQFRTRLKRTGRAIKSTEREIEMNPRARSAILRIAEKLS
jgi:16S rRNA (cytosine1402-N4)-methyltransferase